MVRVPQSTKACLKKKNLKSASPTSNSIFNSIHNPFYQPHWDWQMFLSLTQGIMYLLSTLVFSLSLSLYHHKARQVLSLMYLWEIFHTMWHDCLNSPVTIIISSGIKSGAKLRKYRSEFVGLKQRSTLVFKMIKKNHYFHFVYPGAECIPFICLK